jgi:hypothetical protein
VQKDQHVVFALLVSTAGTAGQCVCWEESATEQAGIKTSFGLNSDPLLSSVALKISEGNRGALPTLWWPRDLVDEMVSNARAQSVTVGSLTPRGAARF